MTISVIRIDNDGRLVDGQHRLEAVAETGISMIVDIVYGDRDEHLRIMELERRTSRADRVSKRRGITIRHGELPIMELLGDSDPRSARRLLRLTGRVVGGGSHLAAALVDLSDDDVSHFVSDLRNGTAPAAAVLGQWLAVHARRPTEAQRRALLAVCKVAIAAWADGRKCSAGTLDKTWRAQQG